MTRAIAGEPNRPDLVWLQAQVCWALNACNPEPLEHRLRELDPENGEGRMGDLTRAAASDNEQAADSALAEIGKSDRVDVYYTPLIAQLTRAAANTQSLSIEDAEEVIVDFLASQAIPGYTAASKQCKGARLNEAATVDVCRGVARAFERGDTFLTAMIGVAIAKRVWSEGSPEWKAADDARRRYEYQTKLWAKHESYAVAHADEYLKIWAQNRREQDVFTAQLIAFGEDPNPPPAQ